MQPSLRYNDVIIKAHIFEMALSKEKYTEILKLD